MATLADRFEAKVDRSAEHHIWLGSKKIDGTGKLKVDGRSVTAHRVAWELAHGALPSGAVVHPCPDVKACVRIEHLSVRAPIERRPGRPTRQRARRGGGSARNSATACTS